MRYALLIYGSAPGASTDERAPDYATDEWLAYTRALRGAGALLAVERLQEVDTATTVRLRGGERLLTDGPFSETKEHLLGFYLVEVADLDAAIEWAARMPHSRRGTVEVRPVQPSAALAQAASG
jgi:hypothetical protein